MKVTIADYGVGNLHSLRKAFQKIGALTQVTADPARWSKARVLILPGVGAFGPVAESIAVCRDPLRDRILSRPTLGICLGMELLFDSSDEAPGIPGLGILPGPIERLLARRLPHLGWNTVRHSSDALFAGVPSDTFFYFVHSYGALRTDAAIAWTEYEAPMVSAVRAAPLSYGVQFHPEKSGQAGLKLIRNFLRIAEGAP